MENKTYPCFNCQAELHLVRNEQAQRWDKFNLDGTEHNCQKKKPFSKQAQDIAEVKTLLQQIARKIENIETAIVKKNHENQ